MIARDAVERVGPFEVEEPDKVFSFLHKQCPQLSKRTLRRCFTLGAVLVNGKPLRPHSTTHSEGSEGSHEVNVVNSNKHDNESHRLCRGDMVEATISWADRLRDCEEYDKFSVIVSDEERDSDTQANTHNNTHAEINTDTLTQTQTYAKTHTNTLVTDTLTHTDTNREGETRPAQFSVVLKGTGYESSVESLFAYVCRERLWHGVHYRSVVLLYELDRGVAGPAVVFPSARERARWLRERDWRLSFTCLVCGKVSPSHVVLPWRSYASLFRTVREIRVREAKVARSRAKEFVSLITLEIEFLSFEEEEHDSNNISTSISKDLKQMKRLLKRLGHPIVGHDDALVKNKGLFCAFTTLSVCDKHVDISINTDREGKCEVFHVDAPPKLLKTFLREDALAKPSTQDHSVDGEHHTSTEKEKETVPFCDLSFAVSPAVMIPRPASQSAVYTALHLTKELISATQDNQSVRVIDLGTGSGCLCLSLLHHIAHTKMSSQSQLSSVCGIAVDISREALDVAELNAQRLGLSERCIFRGGSFANVALWRELLNEKDLPKLDIIVCNPPYSAQRENNRLSHAVKLRDPSLALFAHEKDPLKSYRDIVKALITFESEREEQQQKKDAKSVVFVLEVGKGQRDAVFDIFASLLSRCPLWSLCESPRSDIYVIDSERCVVLKRN